MVGLRVGHYAAAQRTGRGEATLQSTGGAQCAHAAGIPAAVHVRMCRMQSAGKVSMLRWNDEYSMLKQIVQLSQLACFDAYPWRLRSRRQSPWMDPAA